MQFQVKISPYCSEGFVHMYVFLSLVEVVLVSSDCEKALQRESFSQPYQFLQPFVNGYYAKYSVFSSISNGKAREPLDRSTKLREGELLCSTLFPRLKLSTEYLKVDVTLHSQI